MVDTLSDVSVSALLGIVASMLLNRPLHEKGVPELARYTSGGVVVLLAVRIVAPESFGAACRVMAGVGLGVGLSRLFFHLHKEREQKQLAT